MLDPNFLILELYELVSSKDTQVCEVSVELFRLLSKLRRTPETLPKIFLNLSVCFCSISDFVSPSIVDKNSINLESCSHCVHFKHQ